MDVITLTKELVRIPSVNPFRTVEAEGRVIGIGGEHTVHEYLEHVLRERGFRVERQLIEEPRTVEHGGQRVEIPARWNVLAEKGDGPHSLLFFGHTDTVDVKAGWEHDPFVGAEATVDGSRRFSALGANDMKSGLAAIIAATSAAKPRGWKIKLAFLADEEFWSFGAVRLIASDFLDDVRLAIVPELVDEITPIDTQWVGLGRLGRSELCFSVGGRACHGADAFLDPEAVNAVHESVRLEAAMLDYIAHSRASFRDDIVNVTNSSYLNRHEGGRGILSVPDEASFVLDRSFIPGETEAEELRRLLERLPLLREQAKMDPRASVSITVRGRPTPPCKAYYFRPDHPLIAGVLDATKQVCPKLLFGIGRSVADENRIAELGIATVVLGPNGAGSHTPREWVDWRSVERLEATFRAITAVDWAPRLAAARPPR